MYGVELVMDRRCWARKIVDFLDFDEQRLINIMPKKLKARMGQKMNNSRPRTSENVIHAKDFVSHFKQSFTEMRT